MIIDATNMIAGRLGSLVAKKVLLGETVDIINAEKAVVSGKKEEVLAAFKQNVHRGTWAKGPHYIRSPERMLKRLFRDMLPYKNPRGREAFDRIKCYEGVPAEFKDKKAEILKDAAVKDNYKVNYITMKEISMHLGGRVE